MNYKGVGKVIAIQSTIYIATMCGIGLFDRVQTKHSIHKYQTEIAAKDSVRYGRVMLKTQAKEPVEKANIWKSQYMQMKDSLVILGQAKKAYFEGSNSAKINY